MRYEDLSKTSGIIANLSISYANWNDVPNKQKREAVLAICEESKDFSEITNHLNCEILRSLVLNQNDSAIQALMGSDAYKAAAFYFNDQLNAMFEYFSPTPFERSQNAREAAEIERAEDQRLINEAETKRKLQSLPGLYVDAGRVIGHIFPQLSHQGA